MELRHLRTFLAIAEEGSVTAASKRLFTTQPAVTRQLAQLERSLDCLLFDRSHSGVSLTCSGTRLLPEARRILGLADAVVDGCRDDSSALRGRLDISCPEEGLAELTPVVLAAYRAAHPNVDVVVHERTEFGSIETLGDRDDGCDVAMWGLDFGDDRFHVDAAYAQRIELIAASRLDVAAATTPLPVADALELPQATPTDFMKSWAHPHLLTELRNGSSPRFTGQEPFHRLEEVFSDVVAGRAVVGVTAGTPLLPDTRRVQIDAELTTSIGVITKADEQRQHVRNFGAIAAAVGRDLYSIVPEAQAAPMGTTEMAGGTR